MRSILGLVQDGWCPGELSEDYGRGGSQRESLGRGHDGQNGASDFGILLECFDTLMPILSRDFAIDPDMADLLLLEELL